MDYDLELDAAISSIKKEKAKLVCLQLPDGLKPHAARIQQEIEQKTDCQVLIWGGSCYGACDIPLQLSNLKVDLLIQWGHSAWQ